MLSLSLCIYNTFGIQRVKSLFCMPLALFWPWLVFSATPSISTFHSLQSLLSHREGEAQPRGIQILRQSIYGPFWRSKWGHSYQQRTLRPLLGFWTGLASLPAMTEVGFLMLWKNSDLLRSISDRWLICQDSYSHFTVTGVFSWDKVIDSLRSTAWT